MVKKMTVIMIFWCLLVAIPTNSYAFRPSDEETRAIYEAIRFFMSEMINYENELQTFVQKKFGYSITRLTFNDTIYIKPEQMTLVLKLHKAYIDSDGAVRLLSEKTVSVRFKKIIDDKKPVAVIDITSNVSNYDISYGNFKIPLEEFRQSKNKVSPDVFDFVYRLFEVLRAEQG